MSYFGTVLDQMITRSSIKAKDISRLSGVDATTISRLRKGDLAYTSPENVAALALAISSDPKDQAELVRAHLLDETPEVWRSKTQIAFPGDTVENAPPPTVHLHREAEEHFETIRAWYVKDNNVREIVNGLGNVLRSGDAREPEQREGSKTKYPRHRSGVHFDPTTQSAHVEDADTASSSETATDTSHKIAEAVRRGIQKKSPGQK